MKVRFYIRVILLNYENVLCYWLVWFSRFSEVIYRMFMVFVVSMVSGWIGVMKFSGSYLFMNVMGLCWLVG